ncbi:guanine nucleotide exchange factor subunit RIC1-like isoform X1 [Brassica napus]|uniref:guanine nucleotide exchange factor subunit RIC1-like isoform X1 n=1 Tax=Brassica napus TaxID=3708 RepID=UPI0020790032|nr:guanine nucleotide exchange factor subunit RIC1-like isoform X1 [Brassica napus]
MYMAYGWPQVIPLLPGSCPSSQRIVYLKLAGKLLLVVSPSHLELWGSSQQRVRLGKYIRDEKSVREEGENLQAVWSPDSKLIAVLTSSFFLHIYKVKFMDKRIKTGERQPSELCFASISLLLSEQVPFAGEDLSVSNFVRDGKTMLLGLSDGCLYSISWKGEFGGAFTIGSQRSDSNDDRLLSYPVGNGLVSGVDSAALASDDKISTKSAIAQLELCTLSKLLFVLDSDGTLVVCSVNKKGLKYTESIKAEKRLAGDAVCASMASEQQILAVGTRKGAVELYDLSQSVSLLRTVSLHDWGYSADYTGPVNSIAWTPDNSAFAVGWKSRGLAVWSVSGCRLMSTVRQIGLSSASSPKINPNQDSRYEPLMNGTSAIQWDEYGYRLFATEEASCDRILAFSFGKCCLNRGVSGKTYIRQVMYGEDRLLMVQAEDTDDLKLLHLKLPVSYITQNWPVQHVAASEDGQYLAIAGLHGLILYDVRFKKWRVFGDVSQEQQIHCKGLLWLGKIVVICNYIESSETYELLFYPRYHLDQSSLLCRKVLLGKPMVMDVYQDYVLVSYLPFIIHVYHVKLYGELTPSSKAYLELSTVRELSIMTAKSHPAAMRFVPDQHPRESDVDNDHLSSDLSDREPSRCLILRGNGELSLLDLVDGRERELTDSVELFWVTCGQSEEKTNLVEEVSWLDYGHRGMQVWYPSLGDDPFIQEDFLQLDPELEFDREVYPLGLLPNVGVVVGVSQRMSFSASAEFPCFEPTPQAQTILHCLLRHLLQRDKNEEALLLAQLSAEKPHFSHCLEWLLFTVFEADISRPNANRSQISGPGHLKKLSLLRKACDLIKHFPEYYDVVVNVARKTDARHWADLFSAAGISTTLFEDCFQRRWYRTAACYILVIAKLEGPAVSQYCALRLLQATLDESLYDLAGELVRFLLRSGREIEQAPTEADTLSSPKLLGFLIFGSSHKKSSLDKSSSSFKEQSPHVASVKSILESHASYLMSGKELSKLVAFVKGTQFDIVDFLQRERYGCAQLENFAAGLELIGQKLQMSELQNRLDAEFLLAQMCSVKFKEWIVVLATLLQRSEVLYDIFRSDLRLWKAYSMTLQSHLGFAQYHDLLQILEEKLSATAGEGSSRGSIS